jgi:hypothetical protein
MMLTIEDKFEIQELVARFAHCSDYGDWRGMEALYMPDVVTEMDGIAMKYEGIAAQIAHAQASDEQAQGKNRHYHFNLVIEETGGEVFANYFIVNVNAGSTPMGAQIVVTGRHRDRVEKTREGWKFAHRFLTFDQTVSLNF